MLAAVALAVVMSPSEAPPPPPTRREDVTETIHGVAISDPYRWLEDQDAPETRAWIGAQESHCRAILDALPQRAEFAATLAPMYHADVVSEPWQGGDVLVFTRRKADEQLPSICVGSLSARGMDRVRVLVDGAELAAGKPRSAGISSLSSDGSVVAIGVRDGGADEQEIRFLDTATGKEVAERMPSTRYLEMTFMPKAKGVWYGVLDHGRPSLREHVFGTDLAKDREIFGAAMKPGQSVSAELSPDEKWLVLSTWYGSAATKSDVHVMAVGADAPMLTIVDDVDARFEAMPADGVLYLKTTWKAPNERILAVDLANPRREAWREVVPESGHAMQDASLVGGRIAVRYLEDVRPVVRLFDGNGKLQRSIEAPGFGSMGNLSGRWSSPVAFLSSNSWIRPQLIERVDLGDGSRRTWFQEKSAIPDGRFVIEQHWFTSSDGSRVPLFLGRAKDAKPDGSAPVLVNGYGGFAISMLPGYSPKLAAWLLHGGIVALPALRGGSEFGEAWHEQAMLGHKQRTFDDLFAAVDWLVKSGWADPARVALTGRSNGGLLVGAAITQRPELFRAAVCGYPLLDMLRYDRFLVASFWVPEYGSASDPEQFKALLGYSPYQHVRQGIEYPATLFVTGDADTRVAPLHARKMAALMQASAAPGRPILLHYDSEMGHLGGLPADKELADAADELGFLSWQLGDTQRAKRSLGR